MNVYGIANEGCPSCEGNVSYWELVGATGTGTFKAAKCETCGLEWHGYWPKSVKKIMEGEMKGASIDKGREPGPNDCELRLLLREEPEGHYTLFADMGKEGETRNLYALGTVDRGRMGGLIDPVEQILYREIGQVSRLLTADDLEESEEEEREEEDDE